MLIVSYFLFNEKISPGQLVGVTVMGIAVAITSLYRNHEFEEWTQGDDYYQEQEDYEANTDSKIIAGYYFYTILSGIAASILFGT